MCLLNFGTLAFVFAYSGQMIYLFYTYFVHKDRHVGRKAVRNTGYYFTFLGTTFFSFGFLILYRLKWYFREFYQENKGLVLFATMGLCFSCLIRGILDLLQFYSKSFVHFVEDKETWYNLFVFIFCDTIPLGFQLSTLIFGYIRRRNIKKHGLGIDQDRGDMDGS